MDKRVHLFGIRHHGPGSAASLITALDRLDPALVLIEGPADASDLLGFAALPGMDPPVALLTYAADEPALSSFYPFAAFSPEWRAIRWALERKRPVRFIDLPATHALALRQEAEAAVPPADAAPDAAGEESTDAEAPPDPPFQSDPLDRLATISGHSDGEALWNALVESQEGGPDVFAAIETAMAALRQDQDVVADPASPTRLREERREAHMRQAIRQGLKDCDGEIAVIAGAWHIPAFRTPKTAGEDRATLKALPRLKILATWVPWTETRLAIQSGYGAGVSSPGWYGHLWSLRDATGAWPEPEMLASSWHAKVATLLRAEGQPAATASVIEAARLAVALGAVRGHAIPGLAEMNDATLAALCHGDATPFRLVETKLIIGNRVGAIDDAVPQMPLAADLARWQKKTRLAPEALQKEMALDLRSEAGLLKSTLLHRLLLMDVPWGQLRDAQAGRGTFRETWVLAWAPEFSVRLAEALAHGPTIELAAAGIAVSRAGATQAIDVLAELVRKCLTADLPAAARACIARLQAASVNAADIASVMEAVPPLVSVLRYGTARKIPEAELAGLVRVLSGEVIAGIGTASRNLDETAAARLGRALATFDSALALFGEAGLSESWDRALTALLVDEDVAAPITGLALRRLYERQSLAQGEVAAIFARALSPAMPPKTASGFLAGFLDSNAEVILQDDALFALIDSWLQDPGEDAFIEILPMLRRAFGGFGSAERQRLLGRVGKSASAAMTAGDSVAIDEPAFAKALPLLLTILGIGEPA